MPSKRGVALAGARAVAGVIGIGIAVVAVGASTLITWPTVETTPPSAIVLPQPAELQRVCPGPLLTLAEDSSQADAATSVGAAASVYAARAVTDGAALGGVVEASAVDLDAVDNTKGTDDGAPLLVTVPAADGDLTVPLVAGSQSQTAASETIGGFAAAACAEASADAWLVGGSTDIGNTSLLLLSNPTDVVATVDLVVYSETGLVNAPGATGILVQPGTQRIISLAGLAPNVKSPVVQVSSRGGQVVATLEQSVIQGIVPRGVDMIGATSGPETSQVITGLTVSAAAAGAPGSTATATAAPSLRLLVPGDTGSTVQIGLASEDGSATGTSLQVDLQPGVAAEVPLESLTPGSFTVTIDSEEPIVAAAQTHAAGTSAQDFAWFVASEALTADFLVAVAPGPSPVLHLFNAATTDATLTVAPNDGGAATTVTVPANGSAVTTVQASGTFAVTGGEAISASVSYLGDGQLSGFSIRPPGMLASEIRVFAH